jgi:RNA polymerase sigma-70 factor (ECF subfamily)
VRPPSARPPRPPRPPRQPEALALRAQQGSVEAFSDLVEHFQVRLYNFLLRRAGPHDAEDLAQETFIRAWQRIDQYRPRWRFSTWLFTIATRLAAARARRIGAGRGLSLADAPEPAGPAQPAHATDEGARLWAMVDETLGPEQRSAVWLRYAEDLSMHEIALVMGKSEVAVRVMLHRARAALAERWRGQQQPGVCARALAAGAAP